MSIILKHNYIYIEHIHYGKHIDHHSNKNKPGNIPEVLNTELAQKLWAIVKEKNWVDDNRLPTISKSQQALLAFEMATELQLDPLWKPFEEFWDEPNLRQYYQKAINQVKGGRFLIEVKTAFAKSDVTGYVTTT